MAQIVLCSFANTKFGNALERVRRQAEELEVFDKVALFDEQHLSKAFLDKYASYIVNNKRGYGYWVWKPQIILDTLDSLNDGDFLLYIDAGCHLVKRGKSRLLRYIKLLSESQKGVMGFQLNKHEYVSGLWGRKISINNYFLEKNWTKGDLLDYFKIRNKEEITYTPQILSGIILIEKSQKSVDLIAQWREVYNANISLIDDSESKSPNIEGFIENRHDQSVFSILCKLNDVTLLSTDEVEGELALIKSHPILAIRDIGERMHYKAMWLMKLTRLIKSPFLILSSNKDIFINKY